MILIFKSRFGIMILADSKFVDDETWESKSERGRGGRRCVLQRRACEPIRTKISSQRSMHEILNNAEYTRVDIIKFFKERVSVMHTSSRNAHCTGGVYGGWSSRNLELISTLHCGLLQRRTCKPVRKNINSKNVMHEIPNHAEHVIVAHQYNVSKEDVRSCIPSFELLDARPVFMGIGAPGIRNCMI
jgi:hypothetical protein